MGWPDKLVEVLERYYYIQHEIDTEENFDETSKIIFIFEMKAAFVAEMKAAYDELECMEKIDVLVPYSGDYLEDVAIKRVPSPNLKAVYTIAYKWPKKSEDAFVPPIKEITLEIGEEYDRIGSPNGRYVSPLSANGTPQTLSSRAIPYYIPESDINISDSPAYHRYVVKNRYGKDVGSDHVLFGEVASVFRASPPDGGGVQVKLPLSISNLINGDIFYEKK